MPPTHIQGERDVEAPQESEKQAFYREWRNNYHQRMGNRQGLPPFVPPGYSIQTVGDQHEGKEAVLRWEQDTQLMAYGVPKSILGMVQSGDRSSAETNKYVFDEHTIQPITDVVADALNLQLIPDYPQQAGVMLALRFKQFVAPDKEFDLRQEAQDLSLKVKSPNMVLEDRGHDPTTWGEYPVGTLADQPYTGEVFELPAVEPTPSTTQEPAPGGDDQPVERARLRTLDLTRADLAFARVLQAEKRFFVPMDRAVRRGFSEQQRITQQWWASEPTQRAYQRNEPRDIAELIEAWREAGVWQDALQWQLRTYMVAGTEITEEIQGLVPSVPDFDLNVLTAEHVATLGATMVRNIDSTTVEQLAGEIAEGVSEGESTNQIARRIDAVFGGRRRNSKTIARTEVLKANQAGQLEGAERSGVVTQQRWNTSQDDRVREDHPPDGQQVELGGDFRTMVSGTRSKGPGLSGVAGVDINCRCALTFQTVSTRE